MKRRITRLALVALPATLAMATGVATAVDPPPTGPVFPAPGGTTFSGSGEAIAPGGRTWEYSDIQIDDFDPLMWGVSTDFNFGTPKLAMDGAVDAPGEILQFSAAESNLAAGVAVYRGEANLPGTGVRQTRAVVQAFTSGGSPLAMTASAAAGIPEMVGGAAVIPASSFRSNLRFEVHNGSAWQAAKTFFDGAPKSPAQAEQLISSIGGAFYYVPANKLPVAGFNWSPETPTAGRTVEFTSTSTDEDGTIVSTEWDLDGDGQYDDATGTTASTVFSTAGDHTVGVRVTDDRDDSTTASHTISVVPNQLPAASFGWSPADPKALQTVTFSSTSTDSDGVISSTEWDLDGDGEFDDASGSSAQHAFQEAGEHTVGVRVTDDLGGVATATETVIVATCERTVVSQTLRGLGATAGIEQQIRKVNCDVLEPAGI